MNFTQGIGRIMDADQSQIMSWDDRIGYSLVERPIS